MLTQPPDRVSFVNLNPTDEEMQKIMDMGISLEFLKVKTPLDQLLDRSFITDNILPAEIDLGRMSEILHPAQKP